MNAFPLRGNVSDLRHWLDNEGFTGKFIGLDAATLLNSSKDYIGAELSNDESSTLRLWCLIQAAKEERDKGEQQHFPHSLFVFLIIYYESPFPFT